MKRIAYHGLLGVVVALAACGSSATEAPGGASGKTGAGAGEFIRIPVAGTTATVVDCGVAAGSADDVRFGGVVLDNDGLYVKVPDGYWRYPK
jgi:hypothetical protein